MNQLCGLGVSAVNHLAGLRWNPARSQIAGKPFTGLLKVLFVS
jgi:hypothetical protein